MSTAEILLSDLYETLLQLRYPGLAQTTSRDIRETVLARENRLHLLSWLLAQSNISKSDEFSVSTEETKIIKWYTNMGICDDPDVLMGRVPIEAQIFVLKNLLLFVKNVLTRYQAKGDFFAIGQRPSQVSDIFKKHMSKNINIVPSSCGLNSKLSYNDALQYLKYRTENFEQKSIALGKKSPIITENDLSSNTVFGTMKDDSGCSQESDRAECIEKFLGIFAAASSWPKSRTNDSELKLTKSMDNCIDNIYPVMTNLIQTLRSNDEVSNSQIMQGLEKREMPLDGPIEDVVIFIEEVSRLQIID